VLLDQMAQGAAPKPARAHEDGRTRLFERDRDGEVTGRLTPPCMFSTAINH
jgi:hypothetical protein